MIRVGMIGFGAIGQHVLVDMQRGGFEGVALCAALVRRPRAAPPPGLDLTADPERFFAAGLDVVVECAGHDAVRAHAERALAGGADLMVTSVGAFTDEALFQRVLGAARAARKRLILPSAGIGALDILSAGAIGGLDEVRVIVRKDPESWKGTIAEESIDLDRLTAATVLFEGPVREGARLYPKNVNISAAVALSGIGLDRTIVRIVADPAISTHVVEVEARGAFGRFHFLEDVIPSLENQKTGKLVAMAIVKAVRQLGSSLVVGA